jgi:hypothetical protein
MMAAMPRTVVCPSDRRALCAIDEHLHRAARVSMFRRALLFRESAASGTEMEAVSESRAHRADRSAHPPNS